MPRWTNQRPSKDKHNGFDLRRTPVDKPIKGLITCDDVACCVTHFWGGRTVPCEAPDCEACRKMVASRSHCYISVLEANTHDHFLFECTAKAAWPLFDWKETHGTIRGAYLIASRPKRRRNARVEIILKPYDLTNLNLPQAPDIPRAMAVIWQLPLTAVETTKAIDGQPAMNVVNEIAQQMRYNPADGRNLQPTFTED